MGSDSTRAHALNAVKAVWRFAVPEPLRRDIRQRRFSAEINALADRRFMEVEIFPWLARSGVTHLLSIGCQVYTAHYERVLGRYGIQLTTSEIEPEAKRFGAKRHLTADVTQLMPSDFPQLFDAVLFNGVIGHGLDSQPGIDDGLAALVALMRPRAPLICGWNVGRSFDPDEEVYAKAGLEEIPGPTGVSRVTFDTVTHVYDFLRRPSELN
jgi:hypothetical protein